MDRLETRELIYFVAVAEELHFGRAAKRLGMAQPPLSRAIRQLERRLGVTLLQRTSHHVSLTSAGEVLLAESRHALDAVTAAARKTQRAGQVSPRLVLTISPCSDRLLRDILAAYEAEADAIPVDIDVRTVGRLSHLRDGHADLAFLHSPAADTRGLDTEELLAERPLAVLPRSHPLADRASLRLSDLGGETLARWPDVPEDRWPGGAVELRPGPVVRDSGELMQLIALGRTIALEPKSVLGPLRADLIGLPVLDAPASMMVLAWPEQSRSRPLAALVRAATTVAARYRDPLE